MDSNIVLWRLEMAGLMKPMKSPFFKDIDEFFGGNNMWVPFATQETAFPMDIIEREDEFEVKGAVPGVNRENLSVVIENGSLQISASGGATGEDDSGTYLLRGLKTFEYKRTIPNIGKYGVEQDKIKSTYKDGILTIVLPKSEEVKPKSISVEID